MIDLSERVAIVTGASRGIGRAIATTLARQGATVIATARGDHARETVDTITSVGGRAELGALDVTEPGAIERSVGDVLERHRRIDVLVCNAGIARDQLLLRMKRDDWDSVIATNLTSAFLLIQAVLKPMLRQRSGRIIAVSSIVGQTGNAGQANYAASKAGLIGLCMSTAREVASRGITVNVVAPGFIDTDMTRALTGDSKQDWSNRIPLGRLGTPEDVAAAVCFLASDEASYITGHVLAVNGGMYM
jgi:3-oxoacyl-[acyl-carrier protein] reductase